MNLKVIKLIENYNKLRAVLDKKKSSIKELRESLPAEESAMLRSIQEFRNEFAFSSKGVEAPDDEVLREWDAFIKTLLAKNV